MTTYTKQGTNQPTYGAMFTVDQMKRASRESGSHFFDADTMRFFGSRVLDGMIAGRLFITSERSGFDYDSPRAYSVREFLPNAGIETVGEFNGYTSAAQARRAAQAFAKQPHAYYLDGQHGKGGRKVVYVVTAPDAWAALESLHSNFRVFHIGHAEEYMTAENGYVMR